MHWHNLRKRRLAANALQPMELTWTGGIVKTHQVVIVPSNFLGKLLFMSRSKSKSLLACAMLVLSGIWPDSSSGWGQNLQAATGAAAPSSDSRPVLLELFTSEGCSSCPPADEFVQKLDTLQPVPGTQLIVLSEHVDYWDHEGWKDPNSSPMLTERQGAYDRGLGLGTPYTPQIIVDGAKEMRISDSKQVESAFQQAAATPKLAVRIGAVNVDAGNPALLRARVEADACADKHNADVYLAIALDHVNSQVLRGENGGRHLIHVAVVQQITKIGKLQNGKGFAEDVQVKLKPGIDPSNIRVVAFVQASGQGKVFGAALWKMLR
jgi:hypothetical protein